MSIYQHTFEVPTRGRGMVRLTDTIQALALDAKLSIGICHLFVHHTSASLIICENADPQVQKDLETFLGTLVPDGDRRYQHVTEGEDDMSAHIRTVLTGSSLSIPITQGHLNLGIWQGIYLWEHRIQGNARSVTVTIQGVDAENMMGV